MPDVLYCLFANGQSLSTGDDDAGDPPISTTQPYRNVQIADAAHTYDITAPNAAGLSLVPLVAPVRADVYTGEGLNTSPYPTNIGGESPEVACANTLAKLLGRKFATSCVGQGAASYTVIEKGGSGNAYNASLYEAQVFKRLATGLSLAAAALLTHGEADSAIASATYLAFLTSHQSNMQSDLGGIFGQGGTIPLVLSQQNSSPPIGGGENLSAIAQWQAVRDNPGVIIGANPGYHLPYTAGRVHRPSLGYVLQGENYARALFNLMFGAWTPLIATKVVRTGTQVRITFSVPVGPLVFDARVTAPHGTGTKYGAGGSIFPSSNGWTGAQGFEFWTGGYGGTPLPITSCVISGNTVVLNGPTAPDTVAYAHTPDDATPGNYTGGFPDGRCGTLHDSDTFAGVSGNVQHNWAWEFRQGGL